jgi:hypothetical protein
MTSEHLAVQHYIYCRLLETELDLDGAGITKRLIARRLDLHCLEEFHAVDSRNYERLIVRHFDLDCLEEFHAVDSMIHQWQMICVLRRLKETSAAAKETQCRRKFEACPIPKQYSGQFFGTLNQQVSMEILLQHAKPYNSMSPGIEKNLRE